MLCGCVPILGISACCLWPSQCSEYHHIKSRIVPRGRVCETGEILRLRGGGWNKTNDDEKANHSQASESEGWEEEEISLGFRDGLSNHGLSDAPQSRCSEGNVSEASSPVSTDEEEAQDGHEQVNETAQTLGEAAWQSTETSSEEEAEIQVPEKARKKRQFLAAPSNAKRPVYCETRPDVCKEFAETGYCKYGNSCIFAHDRTRFIDDWVEKTKAAVKAAKKEAIENFPRDCFICKREYEKPVYTLCRHFFCYSCILPEAEKQDGGQCPVCSIDLNGVVNVAAELKGALTDLEYKIENEENDPKNVAYQQQLNILGF